MRSFLSLLFWILSLVAVQAQDSFEKALRIHVEELSSDAFNGRQAGTKGEKDAAEYIARSFSQNGLELLYPKASRIFPLLMRNPKILCIHRTLSLLFRGMILNCGKNILL
jgi:hypothetical protein